MCKDCANGHATMDEGDAIRYGYMEEPCALLWRYARADGFDTAAMAREIDEGRDYEPVRRASR